MEIKENQSSLERKQFLMRALDRGNITQEKYDAEVNELNIFIQKNVAEVLKANQVKLRSEIHQIKTITSEDGNMKRGVANTIIKFLEEYFTAEEIRGIFRQGYKIQRAK